MEEGTSQGCPISPLFASFVVEHLLEPIVGLLRQHAANCLAAGNTGNDGQGGISHLLSFADDISSCIYLPNLHFLCEQVRSRSASIGCFVNPHKTRVSTSCNGTSSSPPFLFTILPWHACSNLPSHRSQLCWALYWFQTSWSTGWVCYICLSFLCSPHWWCQKEYHLTTWQYKRPTNLPPTLLPMHHTNITIYPLRGRFLSLTYWQS